MMKANETVIDIEKLEHHDFDLDVEEQTRLQAEGEAEVARVSTSNPSPPILLPPFSSLSPDTWSSIQVVISFSTVYCAVRFDLLVS